MRRRRLPAPVQEHERATVPLPTLGRPRRGGSHVACQRSTRVPAARPWQDVRRQLTAVDTARERPIDARHRCLHADVRAAVPATDDVHVCAATVSPGAAASHADARAHAVVSCRRHHRPALTTPVTARYPPPLYLALRPFVLATQDVGA